MAETAGILEGLGLNPAQVPPEIAQQLGQILRVVVEGMVDVLQARAQVKNQFRLDRTEVRSVENNPLKLSANAEHAIQNLFLTSNPAFLPPVAAFEDAFRDLRFHQLAMIAGIRAAFNAMLKKFEPDTLEAAFERKGKRPSLVDFGSRGRLWEQYRGRFAEMTEDAEANFQRLFGEEFARAYSEQLRRLSAGQRDGRR
jgi:type VI secretion system FHA domain protein